MALANQEAQRLGHEYIGTEHILLGLVKEGSGVGASVLKNLNVNLPKVRLEVKKFIKSGTETVAKGKLPQTPRAKKIIEHAIYEARELGHHYVGTEHLLLGLLRDRDGVAAQVLMSLNLRLEDVRDEVVSILTCTTSAAACERKQTDPTADLLRAVFSACAQWMLEFRKTQDSDDAALEAARLLFARIPKEVRATLREAFTNAQAEQGGADEDLREFWAQLFKLLDSIDEAT